MKIAVTSDHAGFEYKELIKRHLLAAGHEVIDFGPADTTPVDYPDYIRPGAQAVADGRCAVGVVLGGSGNGEAIVANKVHGIRCAVCWSEFTAEMAKKHNDANVISIGQRTIPPDLALRIVDLWLATTFEGGRHLVRINKIEG